LPVLLRARRIKLFCTIKGRETSAHFPASEVAGATNLQLRIARHRFSSTGFILCAFDLRKSKIKTTQAEACATRGAAMVAASSCASFACSGVESTSGRFMPILRASFPVCALVPEPNTTRVGRPL